MAVSLHMCELYQEVENGVGVIIWLFGQLLPEKFRLNRLIDILSKLIDIRPSYDPYNPAKCSPWTPICNLQCA